MEINRPSEQAMKNLYKFVARVLPKYVSELNALPPNECGRRNSVTRSRKSIYASK